MVSIMVSKKTYVVMVGAARIELATPSVSRKCSPTELSALLMVPGTGIEPVWDLTPAGF